MYNYIYVYAIVIKYLLMYYKWNKWLRIVSSWNSIYFHTLAEKPGLLTTNNSTNTSFIFMLLTLFCTCLSSLNIYAPLKLTIILGQRRASLIAQLVENLPGVGSIFLLQGINPGIELGFPALQADSLLTELSGKPSSVQE